MKHGVGTLKVVVGLSFKMIMTTSVTRLCSTTLHQTWKTKIRADQDRFFFISDPSC